MNKYRILCRISVLLVLLMSLTSCVVLLLNGHLSHGYYVSPSESFKCKLPGGAFCRQLKITDSSNAIGETVTFVNMAEDGAAEFSISPAALDGINYKGSNTDDKDLINTKATSKKGDSVTLASLDGTVSWQVVAVRGIWAKEA